MAKEFKIGSFARSVPKATPKKTTVAKKAAASLKKDHTRTYRADQAFAKTTGVGKTAQASRGMNIYAKENIPKGYTVQKVNLKGGKTIAVVGLTKSASAARMVTSQPSGYQNPNQNPTAGKKKPARGMGRGMAPGTIGGPAPKPKRIKKNIIKKQPR
jgi:hypothetical protein